MESRGGDGFVEADIVFLDEPPATLGVLAAAANLIFDRGMSLEVVSWFSRNGRVSAPR